MLQLKNCSFVIKQQPLTHSASAYHNLSYDFVSHQWQGVHDAMLTCCDTVCLSEGFEQSTYVEIKSIYSLQCNFHSELSFSLYYMRASCDPYTQFNPTFLIVNALYQKSEWLCICVFGVRILPLFLCIYDSIVVRYRQCGILSYCFFFLYIMYLNRRTVISNETITTVKVKLLLRGMSE